MTYRVVFTDAAQQDLEELADAIANLHTAQQALHVVREIRKRVETLKVFPDRGTHLPELVDLVAPLGRICVIAGGPALASLNVLPLVGKRAGIVFEMMFARARLGLEPERQGRILSQMAELADAGTIPSPRSRVVGWDGVAEGHRALESRRVVGKLALEVP